MNIVPEPLSGGSRLSHDYLHRHGQVSGFYGGSHKDPKSWEERAHWLDQSEDKRIGRKALADCLRSYNDIHNRHEAVHKSIDLLEREGTLVIAGGQQSGLFTGPMLVIYKAVTIIQAAREAQARLDRPVIPVFWIAGEDHDWDEVNHTYVPSSDLQVTKIKMDAADASRTSVSFTPVNGRQWEAVLNEMQELLADSEYKQEILTSLREAAEHSRGLTDAFAKLMGKLFGKYGLVLLDSANPMLRKLEKPIFEGIIRQGGALAQAYSQAARDLTGLGYELQAEAHENGANLFYLHDNQRLLLYKEEGRFTDRKGLISMSEGELLAELEKHPERFSNNVLTRPLMQDSVLPVLGTVLGQGEIAYWAITRYAFGKFGLQMPLILPRMSFSLVEDSSLKPMEKFGLTFQDVMNDLQRKREEWLAGQDRLGLDDRFRETKDSFEKLYEPLLRDLGSLQPGLLKLGESNKQKILDQMDFLLNKSKAALEQQHGASLLQWERIEAALAPLGRPQERVYNAFYYLNRFGWSLVDRLMELPYDDSGIHRAVYL
ncbi:bacillithiol biosynthesis cysteine-adding enzyme BshC [Paenibacillus sp. DMB20]|uniref:bacillithiol biosynthesis cysteine-adding enzyme BshC n=1 Tax=Paenibacillus sp. DMB20 TaxID=1642570 RepID=UPI000627D704|nr:bacillithiol biosynthesis cysteine-adding enzyme BshC [Paenibacillus sp. DMB20]KKO51496.1 hypothetical protein XI25_25645 [Paenibacillus sp. DMB20]